MQLSATAIAGKPDGSGRPRQWISAGRPCFSPVFRNPSALLAGFLLLLSSAVSLADEVRVAVAANFTETAQTIARQFEQQTGHRLVLSTGSTGQLYTQISQGAPFDVFLAADQERPVLAVENGLAVADSRFTYALGRLVLYSRDSDRVSDAGSLEDESISRLAIANPVTAPYGKAAVEVLDRLGLYEQLLPRLVQGSSITQAWQFAATGNADMGFVAMSQIGEHDKGSYWLVPPDLYSPIAQDAVLLAAAFDNAAAREFMTYLQSEEIQAMIEQHGYGLAD